MNNNLTKGELRNMLKLCEIFEEENKQWRRKIEIWNKKKMILILLYLQ